MERRTLHYIISLLLCLYLCPILPLQAQGTLNDPQRSTRPTSSSSSKAKKKTKYTTETEIEYPFFSGISVGMELIQPVQTILGNNYGGFEAQGSVNLKGRYFPTLELGYGKSNMTDTDTGIGYRMGAPYTRVGIDYNFLYKKAHGNQLLVGLRYGFTSFSYDIADPYDGTQSGANLTDDVWGDRLPFNHPGMKSSMHWMEISVGIKTHVWKPIYMGWSLRFRYRLSASAGEYGNPYYVPGYGKFGSNTNGLTYHIIYLLPFKKK